MKFSILLILFCIFYSSNIFSMGFGDWCYTSANRTQICDDGMQIKNGEKIRDLNRWYFYKDCIIGEFGGGYSAYYEKEKKYFVYKEITASLTVFESVETWEEYLDSNNLNPAFWTRWYDDQYPIFFIIFINAFFFFPVTIFLVIQLMKGVEKAIWENDLFWKRVLFAFAVLFVWLVIKESWVTSL